jgi:hypothetical protein
MGSVGQIDDENVCTWLVAFIWVIYENHSGLIDVEGIGSCYLLPSDFKSLVEARDDVLSDLQMLREKHQEKNGIWFAPARRLTAWVIFKNYNVHYYFSKSE